MNIIISFGLSYENIRSVKSGYRTILNLSVPFKEDFNEKEVYKAEKNICSQRSEENKYLLRVSVIEELQRPISLRSEEVRPS